MPKLSSTDGLGFSPDGIKRTPDIAKEDVRDMTDEQLLELLARIRRDRETGPASSRRASTPRTATPKGVIIEDDSDEDLG